MAGTIDGGSKAAATNKAKYGDDFYSKIGAIGGSKKQTRPKGFAYSQANGLNWHIEAGRKGGLISKRKPNWHKQEEFKEQ